MCWGERLDQETTTFLALVLVAGGSKLVPNSPGPSLLSGKTTHHRTGCCVDNHHLSETRVAFKPTTETPDSPHLKGPDSSPSLPQACCVNKTNQ